MSDKEFRVLLDLFMVSDPWPLDEEESQETIRHMLNEESRTIGYADWVEAYHKFKP